MIAVVEVLQLVMIVSICMVQVVVTIILIMALVVFTVVIVVLPAVITIIGIFIAIIRMTMEEGINNHLKSKCNFGDQPKLSDTGELIIRCSEKGLNAASALKGFG